MSSTLDANLLLYASDDTSPLHRQALEFIGKVAIGPAIVYVFWPTVMAYLRIATHPAIFARPLAAAEAVANMDHLLDRPHIRTPGEQEGFWARFRDVAADSAPAGNLVPDAHLVALMRQNDVRTIWTRDRDFRRFDGIEARDPFE